MMTNEFHELLLLLEQSDVSIFQDHFLKIKTDLSEELFKEILTRSGYIGRLGEKNGGEHFVISLNPQNWQDIPPIYQTFDYWWTNHKNAPTLPQEFFIVDQQISSVSSDLAPLIRSAKAFLDFSALLKELSENSITSDNKAILVSSGEVDFKKRNVSLASSINDVRNASKIIESADDVIQELLDIIKIEDPHQPERKNVLTRTILEVLSEPHSDADILWLVLNSERIKNKYKEQYQLYVHNFSVSRLLNEIDQKSLEFNSKLMDFISNSQNKALTIPGALIAVGALVKSKGVVELFLIVFGVWAVYRIVCASNAIMRKTFDDLEWQIKNSFSKYSTLSEDHVVSASASENSSKLFAKIADAKTRLRQVDCLAKLTLAAAVIYCVFSATSPLFSESTVVMNNLSEFSDFVIFTSDQIFTYFVGLVEAASCE